MSRVRFDSFATCPREVRTIIEFHVIPPSPRRRWEWFPTRSFSPGEVWAGIPGAGVGKPGDFCAKYFNFKLILYLLLGTRMVVARIR